MHDARHIANEFIRRSRQQNQPLTHMQIQKLVYFAHARMLSIHRRPLIRQRIEAWKYGPVVPELYSTLKHFEGNVIRDEIPLDTTPSFALRDIDIIDWCFNKYARLNAFEMSALTHDSGTPWELAYDPRQDSTPIPNAAIEQYYAKQLYAEASNTLDQLESNPEIRAAIDEGIAEFERGDHVTLTRDQLNLEIESRATRRS